MDRAIAPKRTAVPAAARPSDLSDIDPDRISSMSDLAQLSRELCQAAGLSLARLEIWAVKNGLSLPRSTLSEAFNHKRSLRREHVRGIAEACGLSPSEVRAWDAAWARGARSGVGTSVTQSLDRQSAQLGDRSTSVRIELDRLNEQVGQLRNDLSDAKAKCARLQAELDQVRRETVFERERAEKIQAALVKSAEHVGELRAMLGFALAEQQRVTAERDRLENERHDLTSLQERSVIGDELAMYGQEKVEQLEAENENLRRLLGEYQDDVMNQDIASPGVEVAPISNEALNITLLVTDRDFPGIEPVSVNFPWYCAVCDHGGKCSYTRCPHCRNHKLLYNYPKELEVPLPSRPCYGGVLRLEGQGYADAISERPGDVYVTVMPSN